MTKSTFLEGVAAEYVLARIAKAGGNELTSGKFASRESSAALAVNTFGWFIKRPTLLPPLLGMQAGHSALLVDVEYCARFPWRGGRHPWLDAVVETECQLIGIESKRFEPYRSHKAASFSKSYDQKVWGQRMAPFEAMRDALKSGEQQFERLDAAQLVKHAFGLVTDGVRKRKKPLLVYLFAEPILFGGKPISPATFQQHRDEIQRFTTAVSGSEVGFQAISYREWLETWPSPPDPVGKHGHAVMKRFQP